MFILLSHLYIYLGCFLMMLYLIFYQPATPSRPPVVVDWAPGVAPKPDPRTISKHVQRMVDVSASFSEWPPHSSSVMLLHNHSSFVWTILLNTVISTACSCSYCSLIITQQWCLPPVFHSPCSRTMITARTASFLKRTLRKLLLAFLFPSVSWTKRSECLSGHARSQVHLQLQRRGSKGCICSDEWGYRKHTIAAQLTITTTLNSHSFISYAYAVVHDAQSPQKCIRSLNYTQTCKPAQLMSNDLTD